MTDGREPIVAGAQASVPQSANPNPCRLAGLTSWYVVILQ